jgi:lysophospholipase L1-like esterase
VHDTVHALDPAIHFYCQTMIPRPKGPNSQGNTLQDYRNAIIAVQATRPRFTSLVDGTVIDMSASPDGVHPNFAGHAAIAKLVLATVA